ncbi:MAG: manganese efflux pump [Acidimicrobiales bacterium]
MRSAASCKADRPRGGRGHSGNLLVALLTIAIVSTALSLSGLELGSRIGSRLGQRSELVGGAVLVLVGAAVGTDLF